ncbi:MAG: D-alanyl-D-alanine carboxypeptidase, partial [Clostridia bacterium]|nr:D-alanyl-D-alanine carboxypeptidase [Clostridia bacterium]
ELTLEQLLYAVMLESANDAAAAVAIGLSGSIEAFADRMNETAARLGMTDSHFTNPHGLDDDAHYTTAADLAKLTAYAMQNEAFRTIVSTQKYTLPLSDTDSTSGRVLINHNKLLRLSDEVNGVKTGFTKKSGRCLVSSAQRNGVSVIAVTLHAPDDWQDHKAMHELGFSSYSRVSLAEPGEFQLEIPCPGADDGKLTVVNRDALSACLKNNVKSTYTVECGPLRFPPVSEGEVCGTVTFFADGKELGSIPLFAAETVPIPEDNPSFAEKLLDMIRPRS